MENDKMNSNNSQFLPEIRKGRLKTLTIHEISETELSILAQGSPNSIHLNFAIGLFTLAVSFLIALTTTIIESDRVYIIFLVVTIIGFLSSIYFFFLWKKCYISIKKVVEDITKRLPPEGESKTISEQKT